MLFSTGRATAPASLTWTITLLLSPLTLTMTCCFCAS
jgi:hypothetical protein